MASSNLRMWKLDNEEICIRNGGTEADLACLADRKENKLTGFREGSGEKRAARHRRLSYFRRVVTREKQGTSLEKEIIQGILPGSRTRAGQRMTWMNNITNLPMTDSLRKVDEWDGDCSFGVWPTLRARTAQDKTRQGKICKSSLNCYGCMRVYSAVPAWLYLLSETNPKWLVCSSLKLFLNEDFVMLPHIQWLGIAFPHYDARSGLGLWTKLWAIMLIDTINQSINRCHIDGAVIHWLSGIASVWAVSLSISRRICRRLRIW